MIAALGVTACSGGHGDDTSGSTQTDAALKKQYGSQVDTLLTPTSTETPVPLTDNSVPVVDPTAKPEDF